MKALIPLTAVVLALLAASCDGGQGEETGTASPRTATWVPTSTATSTYTPTVIPTSTPMPTATPTPRPRYHLHGNPYRLEVEGRGCGFVWGATKVSIDKRWNYQCKDFWALGEPYWSEQGLVIDTVDADVDGNIQARRVAAMSVLSLDDYRCLHLPSVEKAPCLNNIFQENPVMFSVETGYPVEE